jgi:putative DNA primase/helicase
MALVGQYAARSVRLHREIGSCNFESNNRCKSADYENHQHEVECDTADPDRPCEVCGQPSFRYHKRCENHYEERVAKLREKWAADKAKKEEHRIKVTTITPEQVAEIGRIRHEDCPPTLFELNEFGNAERFAWRYGEEFAYTDATGWLVYRDGVWREDKTEEHVEAMKNTVRLIAMEEKLVDAMGFDGKRAEQVKDQITKWCNACKSNNKVKASLALAQSDPHFAKDYSKFDQKPHLFNCKNGTIDLRNGSFTAHDPNHLLTKRSPIKYDPAAECPKWEKFILDIMDGKKHMRAYLARCCGYTLTADTGEQCFFMPLGRGGTGKSTFLGVMQRIMGDYCKVADAETFMLKRGDSGQPFEMAGMEGVRLLMAIETEEGKRLATAKLKRMTGQDSVTACRKFQNIYSFIPQWKIWLATNDAPGTRADDDAFWDRAKPIPFEVKFRGTDKEIENYADVLVKEEGSGILNWCIAGMAQYRDNGLAHPEDIAKAADEWREEDDWLQKFMEEHVEPTDNRQQFVSKYDLFVKFTHWADETKQGRNIDDKMFSKAMRRKKHKDDVIKQGGKSTRVWLNLRSKSFVERGVGLVADPKDLG